MKPNLKFWLVRPLSVLLFLILLLALVTALLVFSNLGTTLIANNVQRFLPGLELEEVEGALVRGVNLKRLQWKNESVVVELQQLKMNNSLDVSIPTTLQVESMQADKLIVKLLDNKNTAATSEPFDLSAIELPLNINAKQVAIKEVEIWQGDKPIRLQNVTLQGYAKGGQIQLEDLQAHIDQLSVPQGEQTLQARNIDLSADLLGNELKIKNLRGQIYDDQGKADVAASGTVELKEPYPLNMTLLVDSASSKWGGGKATAKIGGELQNYTLDTNADWQYANYPRYQGALKGKGTLQSLMIDALQLKGSAGNIQAKGQLSWQDGVAWNVDVAGQRLNPQGFVKDMPAQLDTAFKSIGRIDATGKPDIQLDVNLLKGKLRGYPVDAKGKGAWNGKVLLVENLDALVGKNRLQAKGQASDQVQVEWKLDAPDLNQLYPKLHGNAKGNGTLQGLVNGSQLQLDVANLTGKVEGYDLNAKGKANWNNQKLVVQDVVVQSGNNRLEASGQATEPFDLRWKVDAKNLAKAWKGLEGSLKGEGTLKGSLQKPQVVADLQGNKLRYLDYRLGAVDVTAKQVAGGYELEGTARDFKTGDASIGKIEAKASQQTNGNFAIDGDLSTITVAGTTITSAKLKGQGSIENHRLTAQINHPDGDTSFAASGGWRNNQWQGTVQNLSLRDTPAGNWDMTNAVQLTASNREFISSTMCLANHQGAQACGKPAWSQRSGLNVSGNLQQVPLVMLRPWLPNTINPQGIANADYRFEQRGGRPIAQVTLRLPDSSVAIRDQQGKVETLAYTNARADLSLNDRLLAMQAQFDLPAYGQVRSSGEVELSPRNGNHRIEAQLNVNMPDISWMERFSSQITQLKGQMTGDVRINGLLAKPSVTGTARLNNGQLLLTETGAKLEAITMVMQANGTDQATITGSLRAGPGVMSANGVLYLADLPNWRANVNLQGNNLKLMDTHEVQAWVSPTLQIQASPAQFAITGRVLVPEGIVSLREIPQGAKALSEDVVIVGSRARSQPIQQTLLKETPLDIQPNVSIELGDKVKFNGFGLDARLTGKIQVLRTRQDIVAEGVLNVVEGVYKAYGQNLTIERGRLLFNGPIDNPGLDVRAVREVEDGDIKVGISLAGTVKQPESTLFSSPQQTQSDTLSYLLTGRAMSTLSGDQSSLLMDAITQLGIAGGESLAQQIGGRFGLDEVGLKTKNGDIQQSELSLGKRLGPRLYVRYIVSLFDSLQRLAITYQINKRLQLEAKTGLYQGLDLIYKIDTDKGPFGP